MSVVVFLLHLNYFGKTDGHFSNEKLLQHTDAPQKNQNTSTTDALNIMKRVQYAGGGATVQSTNKKKT